MGKNKSLRKAAKAITIEISPPPNDEDFGPNQLFKPFQEALAVANLNNENNLDDSFEVANNKIRSQNLLGNPEENTSLLDNNVRVSAMPVKSKNGQAKPKTIDDYVKEQSYEAKGNTTTHYLSSPSEESDFDHQSVQSNSNNSNKNNNNSSRFNSLKRSVSRSSIMSTIKGGISIAQLRKKTDEKKLSMVVGFFFLVVALLIGSAQVMHYRHEGEIRVFGTLKLDEEERRMMIFDGSNQKMIIESMLGVNFPPHLHAYPCFDRNDVSFYKGGKEVSEKCYEWKNWARLNISHTIKEGMNCYNLYWQALSDRDDVKPTDCFPIMTQEDKRKRKKKKMTRSNLEHSKNQGHWYGGGESLHGGWPLERGHIEMNAFVTGDESSTSWGNTIKKVFLNSRGVSLEIADDTPLYISLNNTHGLCIQARYDDFAYYYYRYTKPMLNYTVCTDENLNKIHHNLLPDHFWDGHSQQDLDRVHHLLKKEIWQVPLPVSGEMSFDEVKKYVDMVFGPVSIGNGTAENNNNIDTSNNSSVNDDGKDRGYLLLSYQWQRNMGDFQFNNETFLDLKQTMEYIRKSGLTLVLTINPFVSTDSINFVQGVHENLFVRERDSKKTNVPALTWFKDVTSCALLDITNDETVDWLKKQVRTISNEVGNDILFYVDSGNTFHTPTHFEFTREVMNPDLYRDEFVTIVMEEVTVIGVSSAASKRPRAPAFNFMSPKFSDWVLFRNIVPNVLQLSIIDYPFINPGPVGGIPRPQSEQQDLQQPELKEEVATLEESWELYVRWWQLNTFLPMLHFLKPPNSFPTEMVQKAYHKLNKIRKSVVVPRLVKFGNEAILNSSPIIRPLWSLEPANQDAQNIDDSFLIGDEILVAPILNFKQRSRDVYLPRFNHDNNSNDTTVVWKCGNTGTFYRGGEWRRNMKAGLDDILYFIRQEGDDLPEVGKIKKTKNLI